MDKDITVAVVLGGKGANLAEMARDQKSVV